MQNAPREHSAIRSTFIKLQFVFKNLVLYIFEWPLKTGFTVAHYKDKARLYKGGTKHILTRTFSDVSGEIAYPRVLAIAWSVNAHI